MPRFTRKWKAAFFGALATLAASWLESGAFDTAEKAIVASSIVSLTSAYWTMNDSTPSGDGVPE